MARITVFNQKGGVGKTTTALNLAAALARAGEHPLAIDLDPQAHLTALSGITISGAEESLYAHYRDNKPLASLVKDTGRGWQLVPAHLELSKIDTQFGKGPNALNRLKTALIREQLNGARPVIIDCCPLLGVMSLSAIFAADKVLVPVSADYLAVKGAMQVEKTLNALGPVLKKRIQRRYVITRFDARRKMSWEIYNSFRSKFGADVCETKISESVSLAESPFAEKDVFDHAPGSRGARDYQALYDELKSNNFLQPDIQEMPRPPMVGHAGAFLAGTPHQLATLR
ncbi:MAG: ParA family protein [Burkholderiales bacterium]|jgi:chromosome partitioning protein|nr:ParA family protein [Betaproteobacteria bacterium]